MTIRILLILFFLSYEVSLKSQGLKPESIRSLELLKKTWDVLDTISANIYPKWCNYRKIPVFIGLPNKQGIFINPDKELPHGFFQIKTDTVLKIFVRDTSNVKYIGGGVGVKIDDIYYNRYLKLDIYTSEFNDDYALYLKKHLLLDTIPDSLLTFIKTSEYYISTTIHEAFHVFQLKSKRLHIITKNINYLKPKIAALSYIEGILLSEAFESNSEKVAKDHVSEFIAVKEFKNTKLSRRQINYEEDYQWLEGVAMYVQIEALKNMLSKNQIKTLYYVNSINIRGSIVNLNVADNKDYYYGELQAYILDRIYGQNWKNKILSQNIYFIDLLKEAVEYDKRNKRQLLNAALDSFQYKIIKKKLKSQFKHGNMIIDQKEFLKTE